MLVLMTFAAVCALVQLSLLGSWGRSLRVTTLLLAAAAGFYACGTVAVLLQVGWTRAFAGITGTSLHDVVRTASWTVDPVVEEVVKLLPLVLLAWLWPRVHRQLGLTDHLLVGAALGVGFELFEAALRYSRVGLIAFGTPDGYVVAGSLAGTVTVPSIVSSLTTWLPVPAGFQELFVSGGDTVQHLVWTALAGLGIGWFVRRRDGLRWLGVVPFVVACLDHMNYNLRAFDGPGSGSFPSDAVAWLGARLATLLVVALVGATLLDRWQLSRVRPDHPEVLLPRERPDGLGPGPLVRRALVGPPWSTLVTWRFVLARRAALLAAAVDPPVPGPLAPGPLAPGLLDEVAATRQRLDRAGSAPGWAVAGRRLTGRLDLTELLSWRTALWLLALTPAVVYLVVGGFPLTDGVQDAMRGTVGLWLLVIAGVAGLALVGLQVRPLLAAARDAPEPSVHEARLRPQVRLATAGGAALGGALVLVRALLERDPDQHVVQNLHALDALGDALVILGLALFVASLFLFPPFGLAVATTGELVLVSTITPALVAAAEGSAVLAGLGLVLSEAADGGGSDGSGGSGSSGSSGDAAAQAARQRRIDELAPDPAHGGRVTPGSQAEAEVGAGLEEQGSVQGLRRSTNAAEEFVDDAGRAWDVKAFHSEQGRFDLTKAMRKIWQEMHWSNENIMLDTRHLSPGDLTRLREAVDAATAKGDLPLRVLWWP